MRIMTSRRTEVEKFDGQGDYVLWKEKLLAHLELLGLLEGLEDEESVDVEDSTAEKGMSATEASDKPEEKIQKDKTLKEKRGKARSAIILSLGDHILRKVIKETTAAGMLKILASCSWLSHYPTEYTLSKGCMGTRCQRS